MQILSNYKLSDGTELQARGYTTPEETAEVLTESDKDMDRRMIAAVEAAISRAKICGYPVTYYDSERGSSYIEYPDGTRKYAK